MGRKRISVANDKSLFGREDAEGLDARLLAQREATEAEVPHSKQEIADRAAEIFGLDTLIAAKAEEIKSLKKTREDLVRSLLIGCSNITQLDLFEQDAEARAS